MSTEKYLSEKQMEEIKKTIQREILKRGFTAKIVKFEEVISRMNRHRVEFCTESFQTVPVMFEEVYISNFSSEISLIENEDGDNYYRIWITVNVGWKHFGGGSNGTGLFSVTFNADLEGGYIRLSKLQ